MTTWLLSLITAFSLLGIEASATMTLRSNSQEGIDFKYDHKDPAHKGLCAEVAQLMAKRTKINLTGLATEKTIPKIQTDLNLKKIDIFFCMIEDETRTSFIDFLKPAIFTENLVFLARKDDPVSIRTWDQVRALKDNSILLVNGTAYVNYLKKVPGLHLDDGANSLSINLKKLINKRGRFIVASEPSLRTAIATEGLENQVRILPWILRVEGQYIAVRKDLPPDLKMMLSKSLEELRHTDEYKKILEKYQVQP
ncbi:MAG TPA: transporter substrate-binding domain-containing protein [Bdellovibrio sp.]|uniref:substrate-binding periplasmic protein n=1 Tax=Bdellovibrio sp. TaxID=28201 RepID=UPI002EFE6C7A